MNQDVVDWLTKHLLPFEGELRGRLRRVCISSADVDDVVQEGYFRIMQMSSVAHVAEPRAFLVRMARNLVTDRLRRDAVVSIEAMANLEDLQAADATPGPEQVAMARAELKWVLGLIAELPDRCKEVFRARRIFGLSQKEAASSLGVTEKAVEYELMKGMELISDRIARFGVQQDGARVRVNKNKPAGKTHVIDR